jgi:hypothetical protein
MYIDRRRSREMAGATFQASIRATRVLLVVGCPDAYIGIVIELIYWAGSSWTDSSWIDLYRFAGVEAGFPWWFMISRLLFCAVLLLSIQARE